MLFLKGVYCVAAANPANLSEPSSLKKRMKVKVNAKRTNWIECHPVCVTACMVGCYIPSVLQSRLRLAWPLLLLFCSCKVWIYTHYHYLKVEVWISVWRPLASRLLSFPFLLHFHWTSNRTTAKRAKENSYVRCSGRGYTCRRLLGTSCGSTYLRLTTVTSPRCRSYSLEQAAAVGINRGRESIA